MAGKIHFQDLKNGELLTTRQGRELTVTVTEGKTSINGALILTHVVKATNGVIHQLDTVLN
jgi:uncharacterized surface protein with fasciclin (FAS1) repeats